MLEKIKNISLAWRYDKKQTKKKKTLSSSNYPCLELIFTVPKVFELLKFYCIKAALCRTSNMGYLSTQGQVTPNQNVHYSQISKSSESLCMSWLLASLKN